MADNVVLNAGAGGDTIAADDVAGVKYQVVKLAVGADGAASLVANANPVPVSDAGGSLTVDGTVAVSGTVAVTDNSGSLTVDNAALSVTGGGAEASALRVTLASDSTGVLSVDDNGSTLSIDDGAGSITVDNGGTFAVQAAQSGTWNIGTVTAVTAISNALPAGTNNIGDVDVLSVVPGTGATSLGKAEDAAHASGDTGVMMLGVRRDANTTLAATDGDYVPPQFDSSGNLKVAIISGAGSGGTSMADGAAFTRDTTSLTPIGCVAETSAPTLTNGDIGAPSMTTGGALRVAISSGGVSGIVDDAAFTPGTTEGVVFMAHADETSPDSVDEGDAGALRMTLARALHINVRDDAGDSCMDGTNNALRVNIVAGAGSGGTAMTDDAAFTAGTTSVTPIGALFDNTSTDSVDENDVGAVRMSGNRCLYVNIRDNAGNERGLNIDASGNLGIASNSAVNVAQMNGVAVTMGNGASGTGVQRVTIANDSTGVLATVSTLTNITNWGNVVDDAAFTPATTRVLMAGYTADETATDSVDEGDGGAARMTLDRKQIVTDYAHAAGGATPGRLVSAASTNGTVIKASAGSLYTLTVVNLNAAVRYLKVYNSTSVTVGTTTPTWTIPVPASTTGAGIAVPIPACGIAFGTGICLGLTTGAADNDTGAVAANEIFVNYAYA